MTPRRPAPMKAQIAMPWQTPTLSQVRGFIRDYIAGALPGADALVPNSVMRVISDAQGGLCHLNLQYLDWLALQLMPDTAEQEWLGRFGNIWLVNADGSTGRKMATPAAGQANLTGTPLLVVPAGTQLGSAAAVLYQTVEDVTLAADGSATPTDIVAVTPGAAGNLPAGSTLSVAGVPGVTTATVVQLTGGTDQETDDELRLRVLTRIRQPPMGGDADDYVAWALAVPGVTRAWCSPLEMGMGTVTVRFMCDDLRATGDPMTNGFPLPQDIAAVTAYLNTVRPVAVKDFFVEAPIPEPISFGVQGLSENTSSTQAPSLTR
jgi:uncharacterized phage protein gp47/JayE